MKRKTAILSRMFMIFGLLFLLPCAIAFQLGRITLVDGNELRELWNEQTIDYISIPAQRGNIYDADGSLLAANSVAYKAAVDPHLEGLTSSDINRICETLARHTRRDAAYYRYKIKSAPRHSRYVVLDAKLDIETYEALQNLQIEGVLLEERYRRRYSFDNLAAHLLGFVNHEMEGMIGLEKSYNKELKGTDGLQQVRRDRNGRIFAYVGAPRKLPDQGHSLHTTVDVHIQAILEEELKAGIDRTKSNYGSAILMDPRSGAIKALANYPTYNPNHPATSEDENRRNYAISDMIEPGSTFKLVTAIVAIEQDAIDFDEQFVTPEDGKLLIHGQWMRDHDPLGTLSFKQVIQKSSNIATAKIAMRLTPQTFYQYARNLGFGTPTNIDLPNEETGRLQKPYEWSKVTLPWMAIGYEIQVTPIQLLQAYAAFANRGIMMRPYLVKRITDGEDDTVWQHHPIKVRKIARESTLEKLYPIFKEVVSDSGTAEFAQVEGLPIAGKTGTTQKFKDGQYRSAYRSSFVGFFPADNPKYVALIVLDEPKTSIYGGATAAPIFRQTAKRIAGLDNEIQKQLNPSPNNPDEWARAPNASGMKLDRAQALLNKQNLRSEINGNGNWVVSQDPEPGGVFAPHQKIILNVSETKSGFGHTNNKKGYVRIPDLSGLSLRNASFVLNSLGLKAKFIGSGTVFTQFPEAGELMREGKTVTVRGKASSLETLVKSETP